MRQIVQDIREGPLFFQTRFCCLCRDSARRNYADAQSCKPPAPLHLVLRCCETCRLFDTLPIAARINALYELRPFLGNPRAIAIKDIVKHKISATVFEPNKICVYACVAVISIDEAQIDERRHSSQHLIPSACKRRLPLYPE